MFGLDPDTISNIKEAFSQLPEIEKVLLYGSRAKGDHKNGSDIDITLLGKGLSLESIYKLDEELYQLYLPYTFDISIFSQIDNDDLIEHILSVGKTFYTRNNSQLPKGWEVKKLGEIAKIKGGKRVPKGNKLEFEQTNHPYIRVADFNDYGSIDLNDIKYVNEKVFKEIRNYTISKDDLYLSIAGTIGKTGIVPDELDGANLTENACKLVFKENIDKKFVYYFTKTKSFELQAGLNTRTAAMPKLALTRLATIKFSIPKSLPEQKRIVAILDKAFAAIAKAKANAEQNLKNAKELFESYLQGMFQNKGEGWEEKILGELAIFRNGINFTKNSKGKEIEIVGVKNFQKNFWVPFEEIDSVTIDGELKEIDLLKKGDILAVRSNGNPNLIGRTLLAGNVVDKVSHSGFTIRIRLKSKIIFPIYLCSYLKTSKTRKELVESGNGVGIRSLNQGSLSSLRIPFPKSIKEQKIIVSKLDALSAETKKLEAIYQQKIEDLEELKKSVLQKAFNGELTK